MHGYEDDQVCFVARDPYSNNRLVNPAGLSSVQKSIPISTTRPNIPYKRTNVSAT